MDRIRYTIERRKSMIEERLADGRLTEERLAELHGELNMEPDLHARIQTLKSALMGVKLTVDEAQTLYAVMGESVDVFNAQPVHVKATVFQVSKELLEHQLGR